MAGMQEKDPNSPSPAKKQNPSPSPSQLHKQYWDGVAKRAAAAAKPPMSPALLSGGVKNPPGTLSPRRGGAPMSVKLPPKSPLQGVAANLVKGAHNNPLYSEGQHTPRAAGWKHIANTEHDSKENTAPPNLSLRPTEGFGKLSPKPVQKSPSAQLTKATVTLTASPKTTEIDTVIDISQGTKNKVNFALNTPPNTPVLEEVKDDVKQYSPSNNPFSPRPEFRRSSLSRGTTPGKSSLANWSSIIQKADCSNLLTQFDTPPESSGIVGGSPQFIEISLQQPGSERTTPRRRLKLSHDADVSEDLATRLASVAGPHPKRSRVRFALKSLFLVAMCLTIGQLVADPDWMQGAQLLSRVAPGGWWENAPMVDRYTGNRWLFPGLFDSEGEWGLPVTISPNEAVESTQEQDTNKDIPEETDVEGIAEARPLPVIHLSFDEYDGPNSLKDILPEVTYNEKEGTYLPSDGTNLHFVTKEPSVDSFPASDEPDPDAADPEEDSSDAPLLSEDQADVIAEVTDPDDDMWEATDTPASNAFALFSRAVATDAERAVSSDAARTVATDVQRAVAEADVRTAVTETDGLSAVYAKQVRESALLEMADLAARSYARAFFAALALFAVFAFVVHVDAHYLPLQNIVDAMDDVTGEGDVREDDVAAQEITTPMYLRQGVRLEEPVVVTSAAASGGSPFGRYHAFVRHMTGQDTEAPQLVFTPVQRSRRLADKFRSTSGSPSHRFTISPA